jgi:hypothetical protein
MSVTFVDATEDGEAAVSREDALVDFFNILSRKKQV